MGHRARAQGPAAAVLLAATALVTLVPLLGFLPVVADAAAVPVTGYALLPVLVLPTVAFAAWAPRPAAVAQMTVASGVCLAVMALGTQPATTRSVAGISTIGTLLFAVVLMRRSRRALQDHSAELRRASITDALTGALNRRGAYRRVAGLHTAALARSDVLEVAAIDLDHFKRVNDTAGHEAGDAVLRRVAQQAARAVGDEGAVIRSGGEEFVIVTIGPIAPALADLRASLRHDSALPAVTVSVGVVTLNTRDLQSIDGFFQAIDMADQALYRAKQAGRDRVELAGCWPDDHRGADSPKAPVPSASSASSELSASSGASGASRRQSVAATVHPPKVAPRGDRGDEASTGSLHHRLSQAWFRAVERTRRRVIDRSMRRLYEAMVGWMIIVGMLATASQMLAQRTLAIQTVAALPASIVMGLAAVWWLRRSDTVWGLTPLLVVGTLFELLVILAVSPPMRPAALMVSLLPAVLLAMHWPRFLLAGQLVVTMMGCAVAARWPGRPLNWEVLMAVVTGVALVAVLLIIGAQRRREERMEDRLHRWAVMDPLTGLGNRRGLAEAESRWRDGAVAIVDIDHFKQTNDTHGHSYGDTVLRHLAAGLRDAARTLGHEWRAFRIGGDEFVVAGPGAAREHVAEHIQRAVKGLPEPVSVTVGTASWGDGHEGDLWRALVVADAELLVGKRRRPAPAAD